MDSFLASPEKVRLQTLKCFLGNKADLKLQSAVEDIGGIWKDKKAWHHLHSICVLLGLGCFD